jgi:hypothetical protein
MVRLRDCSWWPSSWAPAINPGEVRLKGIFKDCLLSRAGSTLIVDYEGLACQATIAFQPGLDLKELRDFLLPHRNKPLMGVDSLEFECYSRSDERSQL